MRVCGGVAFRPFGVAFRPRAGTHNNTSHAFDNHAAKSIDACLGGAEIDAGRGSGMEGVVEDIDAGDYELLA